MQLNVKSVIKTRLGHIYNEGEQIGLLNIILNHLIGTSYHVYKLNGSEMDTSLTTKFDSILESLELNIPIQYILGEVYWGGIVLKVNKDVLIPRQETEELCIKCIELMKDKDYKQLLDIGTGSGCIPIYMKLKMPHLNISAMDVSSEALEIAKINSSLNQVSIELIEKNILEVQKSNVTYDVILSNPPYIGEGESIESIVKDNEPKVALFVPDDDVLIFYKSIVYYSLHHLNKGGLLGFECNQLYCHEVAKLLDSENFDQTRVITDMYDNPRFVFGYRR